jgi:Zn-dependent protease with chaperone function
LLGNTRKGGFVPNDTREVTMAHGIRAALLAALTLGLGTSGLFGQDGEEGGRGEKVDGYAEWHVDGCLIADAQRICPAPGMKFKGQAEAKSFGSIPLGYELKAKGTRRADGTLLAREVEAKPNGSALFEGEVRSATDQAEAQVRRAGYFGDDAKTSMGRLLETGPQVARVRRIVDTLLPPYLRPEDVRVYVIENKEWNAFAMGNYSIYVFSGLLDDMDDDEVAIVLGHELVHATHEHSRKQFKRDMWIQLAALGALAATSSIDDDTKKAVVTLAVAAGASAWKSGYGRGMEDQADRVGLRYAYEAGYDITKGPRLWNRFAKRYGEGNKIANFFFSDHSQSAARATKLEREIAFNYADGPKPDGPARQARRSLPEAPAGTVAAAPVAAPAGAQALAAPAARPGAKRTEIRTGMTSGEVRGLLGEPEAEMVFGEKTRWSYPGMTVVFQKGRVADVQF